MFSCPDMMECYMYLYPGKNPYGIDANGEAILQPGRKTQWSRIGAS